MTKGGGTQQVQTTTTNLPEYARPYFERMMDRAEGISLEDYQPYEGQRLADITPDQLAAYDLTRQTAAAGIPGLDTAFDVTGQNMMAGQQMAAGIQPYQFDAASFRRSAVDPYAGFQASQATPYAGFEQAEFGPAGNFAAGDVQRFRGFSQGSADPYAGFEQYGGFRRGDEDVEAFDYGPARQFSGAEVQDYISPYIQNVVDIQKERAQKDYETAQAGRSRQAVQAGAFGGSRAAVQEGIAEEAMLDRMARIQAEGLERGYSDAAQRFEADRAAQLQQQQAQAQELARTQGISVEEAARLQAAQSAEAARFQQAEAAELARTQGIGIDEAARVQAAKAEEFARTNNLSVQEAGRVQAAIAQDNARIQGATADEFARIQQSQAAELARIQGISVEEAARVQQAEAMELARTQGITVDEAARVQAANAAERARVQTSQADEFARARDQQLAALGFSSSQAQQLAELGEMARAGDIQSAQLLETIGGQLEAREQQGLDLAYGDFREQRDYPKQQLNYLNSILRGVPIQPDTATNVPYNPVQQLLGGGLGALGLYRGLTA